MTESVSTDKLQVMADMVVQLPIDKMTKLKSLSITWEEVSSDCICPNLSLTFFE